MKFILLTAALATIATAAPTLETRTEEPKCFKIQARSCPNANVRGKWLTDGAYFKSWSSKADIFTLDGNGRLRVADDDHKCYKDQAEVLVVKSQSKHFDGKADFKKPKWVDYGKYDVAKCWINGDNLQCQEKAYAKKDKYLYFGSRFDGNWLKEKLP